MAFSCSTPGDVSPQLPLTFSYTLLNASGDLTTTFQEGEDITFRFRIENTSAEDIFLYNPLQALASSGAFFVEQNLLTESNQEAKWVQVGRACIPTYGTDIGGMGIGANSTSDFKYSWLKTPSGLCEVSNTPLKKGSYRSTFTCKFRTGNGGTYAGVSTTHTFNVQFTVK